MATLTAIWRSLFLIASTIRKIKLDASAPDRRIYSYYRGSMSIFFFHSPVQQSRWGLHVPRWQFGASFFDRSGSLYDFPEAAAAYRCRQTTRLELSPPVR